MAPAFVSPLIEECARLHGYGTLHSVLEALSRSHVLRLEMAPHGCFVKAFYTKKNISACSTTSPGTSPSPPSSTTPISRSGLLSMRTSSPPGLHGPRRHLPLRCVNLFDMASSDGNDATAADTLSDTSGYVPKIKNTFIEFTKSTGGSMTPGACSAPEFQSGCVYPPSTTADEVCCDTHRATPTHFSKGCGSQCFSEHKLDSSVQRGILPDPGHQGAAASNAALRIQSCFRRILAKRRVDTLRMVHRVKAIDDQNMMTTGHKAEDNATRSFENTLDEEEFLRRSGRLLEERFSESFGKLCSDKGPEIS